jgi:hypothetical protein
MRFGIQEFLQFGQARRRDSTAQSKDNELSIHRSLNLKHRFGRSVCFAVRQTHTNLKRLKKLESADDKMPTFRKLPKVRQRFLPKGGATKRF